MFAIVILLVVVLILVLAPDHGIVVQPQPPPVQESANRTRETTSIIVAGERVWFPTDVYPVQQQEVTGRTAFAISASDEVWYYRGAGGQADNGLYHSCCYLLIPRRETNHCRREEMVSSFEYKVPKNCVI